MPSLSFLFVFFVSIITTSHVQFCKSESHYNIPDPECTGAFGVCTPNDKLRLGRAAVARLHEKMDEDKDGTVEVQETNDFIEEDLDIKNGVREERHKKFHGTDSSITIEEMWKSWQYSAAYNWTTEEVVTWVTEQCKLPQYADNLRRNFIDGQFLPRLLLNEKHYLSSVMQISEPRHKRMVILKATDVVLFGVQQRPHNLIKDAIMIGALTLSIIFCIFLFSKHRNSTDQIKLMLIEFEKLNTLNEANDLKLKDLPTSTPIGGVGEFGKANLLTKRNSMDGTISSMVDHNKMNGEYDMLGSKVKLLSKDNSQDDEKSLYQLKLAELELERMRATLKKTESRLDLVKYQPPLVLITLLNKTYEAEKALLDFKLSMIEKDKLECVDALNRVVKRQAGFMGALKIAHSSTLEDIQHRLEGLKLKHQKLKLEQQESMKRWNNIFEMCSRSESNSTSGGGITSAVSSETIGSQDIR